MVLQCSFIRHLFVRCVIIDRCEWTLTQQFSLSLCFEWFHWWEMSVLFCCEKDKCPINFVWLWAFKRTNLLTILCDSGNLSCRYPYGCTPLWWWPKKKKKSSCQKTPLWHLNMFYDARLLVFKVCTVTRSMFVDKYCMTCAAL